MPKVSLRNVTKRFGGTVAVDRITFDVGDGELFVLVGPNGCGKTTILRLIAGVIKQDEGDIFIGDVNVRNLTPSERGVRMVFQNYALYPHMKVYEEGGYSNLSFAMKLRKYFTESIRSRIEQVSFRIGIGRELYPRRPRELSAGQQQKVAIGRAITLPPKVFLLDEPLVHLDPPSRLRVRGEIKSLHQELKATTVYVTNELPEAFAVADRLAVMREGRIVQIGRPREVYENPSDQFVADFLRAYDLYYR
ncbi:MAG: ABC transporter ATP-binding protein [Nitrososphaeria archaeon]